MTRHAGIAVALTLLAGAVATGCGGDDEESLSKAEYIKRGDAICRKAEAPIYQAAKSLGDLGTSKPTGRKLEAYEAFTKDALVPALRGEIKDLRGLPAPEGDEDRLDTLYDTANEALDKIEADPQLGFRVRDPVTDVSEQAKDYGFKACILRSGS